MRDNVPRLRMFAGPNGSGKTTVKLSLNKPESWFGIYINPDDLEASIRRTGRISASSMGLDLSAESVSAYFATSPFLADTRQTPSAESIARVGAELEFRGFDFNSYHASVLSDFLRREAIRAGRSLSFETVMSSADKIELLREARGCGYRTYLYFVATEDPAINVQRVKNRVASGGHDVPADKIISRYRRSLELLQRAIPHTDRAFFFDTSEERAWFFAEITDGEKIELQTDEIPSWFEPIWDSL